MIKITVRILTVLTVSLLSGCAVPMAVSMVTGAASVAVNETTGKTLTDHTVSTVNGRDCRVSRAFNNQDVCQEEVQKFQFKVTTTGVTPSSIEEIESKYK
jgi:hypothetical protein